MSILRMGLDIGSTTVKAAVLDEKGEVVFSAYQRHNAETVVTLHAILQDALARLGNCPVDLLVTGSAGMGISESYHLPFIQEVIASAEVVRQMYPQVRTLVDIGGEDAKIIFFDPAGTPRTGEGPHPMGNVLPDIRMNGSCAGGTGAFIDQMATLLNVTPSELDGLAAQHKMVYPMASRCGVFAKTDVQNLIAREISRQDISASIFYAVVLQVLSTLGRGRQPQPPVLFGGGPLTFLPELKKAFMEYLELGPEDDVAVPHRELLPALGAALAHEPHRRVLTLLELSQRLEQPPDGNPEGRYRLPPLFADREERQQWMEQRFQRRTPRVTLAEAIQPCFLGIDSGSTTTKLVLLDSLGSICFTHYASNNSNPIDAVRQGLEKLAQLAGEQPPTIARTIVTGYGEDLIRTAFHCDRGMVETLAHYRAARAFDPQVSFILDIGGQDMKAIFIQNGRIQNIEINEACSSGCGSFIETFARSMGYSVVDFANKACDSTAPCDLGTRCTVFMNSRVKQALREGAPVSDISAGLAVSVIKNALHKVLKITNTEVLGKNILVQGGSFRNPAIHRSIEQILEKKVVCPDIAELMGAYGAALTGSDEWHEEPSLGTHFVGLKNLPEAGLYTRSELICRGCENRCTVTKLTFSGKQAFYTGNRCERIYTNSGRHSQPGASLPDFKYNLIFDRPTEPQGEPRLTIGIPRVLNLFENYPFWCTLLVECGFRVKLSSQSSKTIFSKGAGTVMSENICYPAKMAHGHLFDLIESGVDRIFYPTIPFEQNEFSDTDNCFNCPIVTGYPDVLRSAVDPEARFNVPYDHPVISLRDRGLLKQQCFDYLSGLDVDRRTFDRAFRLAWKAQVEFKTSLRQEAQRIMQNAGAEGRPVVLMLARPYHCDPAINHKIPEILSFYGVDVITEDSLPLPEVPEVETRHVITQWQYPNRYYVDAHWVGQHPDIDVIQLNSFGCGLDAIAVDEVRDILLEYGRSPTVIRIDEIESTGSAKLRLRSMLESRNGTRPAPGKAPVHKPRRTTPLYQKEDNYRLLLTPEFSHFCTVPITRPIHDMGYKVEVLPPADRQSVELALKYTNNEICYPAIIYIGDILKALKSGRYDSSKIGLAMAQTCAQCRYSNYLSLSKKALVAAGYPDIPIVAIATNFQPMNEQPGFKMKYGRLTQKLLLSITYSDAMSMMYHATAVRECNPGETLRVADEYLGRLDHGRLPVTWNGILEGLEQAVDAFNRIPTRDGVYPKAGVVGEIYVKLNSFGNNYVVQWLMSQGIEVLMPPLMEYYCYALFNHGLDVEMKLKHPNKMWLMARLFTPRVYKFIAESQQVLSKFKHFRPNHHITDIAAEAEKFLSLANRFGEGWLIAGEAGSLVRHGVRNVLCLQPFGCLANHIIAKGISKRLKETYPEMNLLFLDTDFGLSEVNFFNRLHFFVHQAKAETE